jgi:uncharacterized membrane protein
MDKRLRHKGFWLAIFSLVAITGQVFGLYQVPDGYDTWVNAVLAVMTAAGVFLNPTTSGFRD